MRSKRGGSGGLGGNCIGPGAGSTRAHIGEGSDYGLELLGALIRVINEDNDCPKDQSARGVPFCGPKAFCTQMEGKTGQSGEVSGTLTQELHGNP